MATLTVDFATDELNGLDAQIADFAADAGAPNVAAYVVSTSGPAADWPVVRFVGTDEEIAAIALAYDLDA